MAKKTAAISLSSDITDSAIGVSNTSTLWTAGTTTGLTTMTSVTKVLSSTDNVDLITTGSVSTTHGYVYINNPSTDHTEFFHVHIGNAVGSGTYDDGTLPTEEIGRLYGGDWMFFPYSAVWTSAAHANNQDIDVTPSNTDSVTLEYMIIYE